MSADKGFSVVLVSVIWVIVLSRTEQSDFTCTLALRIRLQNDTTNGNPREHRQLRHMDRPGTQHGRHLRLHPKSPTSG